jgi:steroid Delta-isomerase
VAEQSPSNPAVVAVTNHVRHWNAMDRESWVALFSPDVVFEDPVGSTPKVGQTAVHNSWDRSFVPGRRWTLHPTQIVGGGSEAAVVMRNEGDLSGRKVRVDSIEVFRVDGTGRIVHVRAFFEQPTEFALSDYFTPDRRD